jgi:tRNA (uracil-5-)-methyltransferase TRM9
MQSRVVKKLIALNREFYQSFGREFSTTRARLQPGVSHILDRLGGNETILDLGCGNGELTRELMRAGHRGRYVGVDFSLPLLEVARRGWEDLPATFVRADLTAANWAEQIRTAADRPFDLVTAFAVLHHIPGAETRLELLKTVHSLLRAGGRFIHSEWQFLNSKKLTERIQPWSEIGISKTDVDPGDYLLDWRSGGRGLRYVHHFDTAELDTLAAASGFRVCETFPADGQGNNLGLYQVWEKV